MDHKNYGKARMMKTNQNFFHHTDFYCELAFLGGDNQIFTSILSSFCEIL
jgi:hypothetical protein